MTDYRHGSLLWLLAAVVTVMAVTVAACGDARRDGTAATTMSVHPAVGRAVHAACENAARTWNARSVLHAYQSTAGLTQKWRQTRNPQVRPHYPKLSAKQAATPVAVCYLRGTFTGIPSAPGASPVYRELIVMVNERTGQMTLDAAGPRNSWPFKPPPVS